MLNRNLYKKILTLRDYSKIRHTNPYVIHLKNNKQEIIFFGTKHSWGPKDAKYQRIEKLFKSLIDSHPKRKIVALIENFVPPKFLKTPEEMIGSFGESGFVYYIARKANIAVICPEPNPAELLEAGALATNDKIGVAAWAFLNAINWMLRKNNPLLKEDIKATQSVLTAINESLKISKGKNPEKLLKILTSKINSEVKRKILPSSFDNLTRAKLDSEFIKKLQDPFIKQANISDAGMEVNRARDYFIAQAIIKQIKNGKSVFAVFGINHVVCEKNVVLEAFKKAR